MNTKKRFSPDDEKYIASQMIDSLPQYAGIEANKHVLASVIAKTDYDATAGGLSVERVKRLVEEIEHQLAPNEEWHERQRADVRAKQHQQALEAEVQDNARKIAEMTRYLFDENAQVRGKDAYQKNEVQQRIDEETRDLSRMSTEKLNECYAQWSEQKRLRGLSREELKAELKASEAKRLARFSQFETLPETYAGESWSASMLSRLGKEELKGVINRYGSAQINQVIQGRK